MILLESYVETPLHRIKEIIKEEKQLRGQFVIGIAVLRFDNV